jgi:hypothetical protein
MEKPQVPARNAGDLSYNRRINRCVINFSRRRWPRIGPACRE